MYRSFMNLNIRNKLIAVMVLSMTLVVLVLGYYSFQTSKKQIVHKVSATNLSVAKVIDNNLAGLQRTISDWSTVFILSSAVQSRLQTGGNGGNTLESALYSGPTSSIMDQMLVTGNFDYLSLYGLTDDPLYQVATDDSSGAQPLSVISDSQLYTETVDRNGAPYWFPLTAENNRFVGSNRKDKIGMTRIIRSTLTGDRIGFLFVGVNKETVRSRYLKNLYDEDQGILVLDERGAPLLSAGRALYDPQTLDLSFADGLSNGSKIVKVGREELLLSSSKSNSGWQILYAVPMDSLTHELNSIKLFVAILLIAGLLLSVLLVTILTSFITAPIKNLLQSMKRFQSGRFDEKVEVLHRDEIGQLSRGYNTMVANIKSLVDETYVLRLKEKEAELKALQSQINPHFLYNMLDTIFWEAESAGQDRISEMVINLSRLFRLSLNRGKSFTSVAKEKELIELYLSLQSMRFKDKLTYRIDIPDELNRYVILKLSLQPFIENALVHGIERKREGGHVQISGALEEGYLRFRIEDNGSGMEAKTLREVTELRTESDVNTQQDTGGYAVQNVLQRLKHYYRDNFRLEYKSKPGEGTLVELVIPAQIDIQEDIIA
ncbi:sensor histidine kinase [Cohnella lubricantis]|uniref:Sensor histidine kinase n=1 Tax=Cohnella lubricantis TaxID=2163172 RepID=A0A841T9D3_9BACL|nr:sensor histidine kinase [Cohnella lubricantis]MBB6677914.1 sensor histidine kinase [Cohnella lubricantis]MBP2120319.1 two-component system sensor histidine kinase YesM [Cohnella lubricantis]